ncbi:MAG: DNA repair protein RadA [Bacteroidales bacterium]|nr:DNA repair protein RadA [Bacteroidales bacterium]
MAKQKTAYFCSSCGCEEPKWFGRCPSCGEWGTCVEEVVSADGAIGRKPKSSGGVRWSHAGVLNLPGQKEKAHRLSEIEATEEGRYDMHDAELNRVLGGGLVKGSMVLLGGDPGIGKSTLLLQTVLQLNDRKVLYCSGEESAYQLKLRANRLKPQDQQENALFVACETDLDTIFTHVAELQPDILIVDSIQTIATDDLESSAGSVGQIRECAARLLKFAKESGTPVILVGHITKEGSLAGPKVLEHIVDTVLQFEGDQHYMYRILRATKNRFGSTSELGIYEMLGTGLRQVSNPSELLLSGCQQGLSGVTIAAAIEGLRPFLIETQSLVSSSAYATPMRSTTGFDGRRLNMLLAVLEKKVGFKLGQKDVFLNIAGGLRVSDPAMDLAVISAVLSSNMDIAVDGRTCLTGEVGLSGEIRPVSRLEQRILEAEKLGFQRILIPDFSLKSIDHKKLNIEVCPVRRVEDAFRIVLK